ncbi:MULTISPECIES: hypothetical protein [unclassified Methanosarcina]|nr:MULTISPECIES: hypothetical protein [unclassified Methanosarcina]
MKTVNSGIAIRKATGRQPEGNRKNCRLSDPFIPNVDQGYSLNMKVIP